MGETHTTLDRLLRFCLEQKLIIALLLLGVVGWGVAVAPFSWDTPHLPRSPIPVDAIPAIGENQQIVFTEWMGRSPQDVEDQITYPLTVALLGVPGVKTVRSYSFFGFSTIYIIFKEDVEFYWSRSRVLEKLSSLPRGTVPADVQPALGPDATALGQVYWYTLEGHDPNGNPTGGWGLEELRSIQDWQVRYALLAAEGVSEVGSIGGYVEEYQIDVDPDAMRAYGVTLNQVFKATRASNLDVGARTIEVNGAEYVIRGLGFIKSIEDVEEIAVGVRDNVPIRIRDVAHVARGPALRRGALDKGGAEAVGGVVAVRHGFNPLAAIGNTKDKIAEISPGLPAKAIIDYQLTSPARLRQFAASAGFAGFVENTLDQEAWVNWLRVNPQQAWPDGVTLSQVTIVPFYDRTGLIYETLGTLSDALTEQILITMIVILIMVMHLRSAILISALLPVAVLITFIAMKLFGVSANLVALTGIAIAIGTMVDMGVIVCENILRHRDEADPEEPPLEVVFRATREVAGAVLTAVATTIVSFLPVFTLTGAEGKLFTPLAFTKTFALFAAVIVALTLIPRRLSSVFSKYSLTQLKLWLYGGLLLAGFGSLCSSADCRNAPERFCSSSAVSEAPSARVAKRWDLRRPALLLQALVAILLAQEWLPLGPGRGAIINLIFVLVLVGGLLLGFTAYQRVYPRVLAYCLARKKRFLSFPLTITLVGIIACAASIVSSALHPTTFGKRRSGSLWIAPFRASAKNSCRTLMKGRFSTCPPSCRMPPLGKRRMRCRSLDEAIGAIPEIASVVGKLGRADTPLDPARSLCSKR